MASIPVSVGDNPEQVHGDNGGGRYIRVIVADTQAIFRAGLRKIFAVEDDIRVVGQAETEGQTISAIKKFAADIVIFEATLAENPAQAVAEILKSAPGLRVVVVTPEPNEELTLDLFRRGAYGVVSKEVEPEVLLQCLRKVAKGEAWLDSKSTHWVLEAFRTQGNKPTGSRTKVQLTPKESLIVSCVTQGMKNKEIAVRVGTTEQVVKNYLRKVYDKLGVADRLELALYCLSHRMPDNAAAPAVPEPVSQEPAQNLPQQASAAAAGAGPANPSTSNKNS
jgi:DNA-binding NarL/FixJ family response regulator